LLPPGDKFVLTIYAYHFIGSQLSSTFGRSNVEQSFWPSASLHKTGWGTRDFFAAPSLAKVSLYLDYSAKMSA
jgi:hypothetical protein